MREESLSFAQKIYKDIEKNRSRIPEEHQLAEKHLLRVCQILKDDGWLTKAALKDDGFAAFTFIISNNKAFNLQRQMLPVLSEAAKKGYIGNPLLAGLVDSIRTGSGIPQIFGTQAAIREGVIYLYPLMSDQKVDEWRASYDLPPLKVAIQDLERRYLMPVLKSQRLSSPAGVGQNKNDKNSDTAVLGISDDENETIKVASNIVNLNVRILTQYLKGTAGLDLSKEDFSILENGVEQQAVFFSTTDKPFDLVLLLDFSGSTMEKRGLVKKAAKRFVEYARPGDRIAIVVFASSIETVVDLTTDKALLTQKIDKIEMNGGSPIWDSLKYTYENIINKESVGRRSAIVFMTDGEDNSRQTTFADILELVRHGDTTIFSVGIFGGQFGPSEYVQRLQQKGQLSLRMLAEESGGEIYNAKDLKDLNGIYETVINDLGKVYSIGYEPTNESHDGGWRKLVVQVKNRPNLIIRTRRGYYAK